MEIKKFGTASSSAIQRLEQKYDLALPEDYKDFLYNFNGGLFESTTVVKLKNMGENINLSILFGVEGVGVGDENTNVDFWMSEYGDELPPGVVIIGDALEHGFILLLCEGEESGIYYWDDTRYFKCSSDEGNTYFIAETFTEFAEKFLLLPDK